MPRRYKLRRLCKWLRGHSRLWQAKQACWHMICYHLRELKGANVSSTAWFISDSQRKATLAVSGKGYAKQKLREKRLINIAHRYSPFLPTHWHQGILWPDIPPPPQCEIDRITQ